MKIQNIALTVSLVAFAIGFSDAQENIFFYLGRPVGAVALIIFFIFSMLENEFAASAGTRTALETSQGSLKKGSSAIVAGAHRPVKSYAPMA